MESYVEYARLRSKVSNPNITATIIAPVSRMDSSLAPITL